MGTPCKCCGKIVCKSRLIRFDHDRYNYDDVVGFAVVTQKIEHKVGTGASRVVFDSTDSPVFCPPDSEPIACNLEIVDVENTTINSAPVIIKTTTKIERKFALTVPINDVYDWGEKNSKEHEFIYSKYIRAGNGFDSTNQAPSCENAPGAGDNFPLAPDMQGEVRILKATGTGLPFSIQEWENQKNSASEPKSFTGDEQKEIRVDYLDEIDGNGTYILLVECPEENSKVEWGNWFVGTEDEVNDKVFIELRRITDLEVCDGSQSFPAFKNHDINGPDDLDDWHEDFMRVADGDYRSLKSYMDAEVNFGAFFGADYLEKYFLFCGKLHFGFFQGAQPYLDALYEIAYNRDDKHLLEVEFPDECPPDSVVGEDSPIVAEIIDPVTNETKQIKKLKSFLGAAPTDIMPTSCPDDGCGSKYVDGIYQYTPEQDENIHRFRYKITGGEDRFNGADYVIDEMRTNFISCDKIKPLSDSKNDDTCTATYFTKECATEISGAETKGVGIPKKAIRRGPDLLNGWFIRPCVIESSAAAIPTQTGSTRRIYNRDVYQQYLFVPHYGEYDPATINFKIEDYEFYPYILKINDVNEECPKECLPTEHAPEWNVSSSFCSQTPAKINYKEYGTQGGASDRHITRSFDHFECGAVLQSCRQLQDCMGSYAESTSFSMVTNVFKASVGSVWSQGTDGVCHYPRCNSYHRNGEGLSCGSAIWELTNQTLDGTFDWFLLSDPQDCLGCVPQKPSLDDISERESQDFIDGKPVTRTTDCKDPNSSHLDDSDAFPNLVGCKGAGGRGGGGGEEDDSERDSILAQSRSSIINSPGDTVGPDNGSEGRTSTCLGGGSVYIAEGKDYLMIGSHNVCEQGNCGVCGLYCDGILKGLNGESTIIVNQTDPDGDPNDPPLGDHFYHYNGPGESAYFCYNLDLSYQKQITPEPLGCCTSTKNGKVYERESLVTKKYCDRKEEEYKDTNNDGIIDKFTTEWDEENKCCPEDKGCCTVVFAEGFLGLNERLPGMTEEQCENYMLNHRETANIDQEKSIWYKTDDGECPPEQQIGFCCNCVKNNAVFCADPDNPCKCNKIVTKVIGVGNERTHEENASECEGNGNYIEFTPEQIDECKAVADFSTCLKQKANQICNELRQDLNQTLSGACCRVDDPPLPPPPPLPPCKDLGIIAFSAIPGICGPEPPIPPDGPDGPDGPGGPGDGRAIGVCCRCIRNPAAFCRNLEDPCACNVIVFEVITGATHEENQQQCGPEGFLSYTPVTEDRLLECRNAVAAGGFLGTVEECLAARGGADCRAEYGINGGTGCCLGDGPGGDGPGGDPQPDPDAPAGNLFPNPEDLGL